MLSVFKGKTVVVTGHTGFKGSWLTVWLNLLGARVVGISLVDLPTSPAHFEAAKLSDKIIDHRIDIRDFDRINKVIMETNPDFLFHLAAQPLVRQSYKNPIETYEAAKILVKEDFIVLPYMPADPVLAKRLEEVGCAAVMPLGSAIGSGQGLQTTELVKLIIRDSNVPVIVDAGIRSPSQAAAAMEMGCDAVLVNSAIAASNDPCAIAEAFALAVKAGRKARLAGIMSTTDSAVPTSPLTSFLSEET